MHLSQKSRKSSNGETLIGLIDAAQAIVLTLLVIELPVLIIEFIEHTGSIQQLYFAIGMDLAGYLLSALIVYDIWSIQKSLFQSTQSSKSQNLACISTLWLSTLIPPMIYIAEHFAQSSIREPIHDSTGSQEALAFRTATIFIILLIHLILFLFSRKKDNAIDPSSVDYNSKLLRVRLIALSIVTPISLALGFIGQQVYVLTPFILFVPFIFVPVKPLRSSQAT